MPYPLQYIRILTIMNTNLRASGAVSRHLAEGPDCTSSRSRLKNEACAKVARNIHKLQFTCKILLKSVKIH